jgi:hypothetical protein
MTYPGFRFIIGLALLGAACGNPGPVNTRAVAAEGASQVPAATTVQKGMAGVPPECPVTVPPQPGFTPPGPYPPEPPALYQAVWYGTEELWTMLSPEGEVWRELPKDGGVLVQKTLWWREGYSALAEPEPAIAVSGRRLDRPGPSFEGHPPGTHGIREDIGDFMLVGIGLPSPGCWEITARYGNAELSYVAWVDDD